MIEIDSQTPRAVSPLRVPATTIYRDTPLAAPTRAHFAPVRSSLRALTAPTEPVSDGILFGLLALMVPIVIYSIAEALSLSASGSLDHAVQMLMSGV